MSQKTNQGVDWLLLIAICLQLIIGVAFVYSTSGHISQKLTGDSLHFLHHQLVSLAISVVMAILVFKFLAIAFIRRHINWIIAIPIGLLLLTLAPSVGYTINGANRWLDIGPLTIFVMPIATMLTIIFISGLLANNPENKLRSKPTLWLFLVLASFAVITQLQPDTTGLIILLAVTLLMCVFASWYKFPAIALLSAPVCFVLLILFSPYRWERLISLIDPWHDPWDSGYQLTQSLTTVGGGNWWGVGFGAGHLKDALPSSHDSFIFAHIIQEIGSVGGLFVIGLSVFILYRSFYIAKRLQAENKRFESILVFALASWIAILSLGHLSGVLGVLPLFNVPYPFISYSGMYLICLLVAAAIILKLGAGVAIEVPENNKTLHNKIQLFVCSFLIGLFCFASYRMVDLAVYDTVLDKHYEKRSSQ